MNRRFLSGVLGAVLISLACVHLLVSATPLAIAPVVPGQQGQGTVCKYETGGIQFVVPPGWEIAINKDGEPNISRHVDNNYILAFVGTLPQETSALKPEQMFKTFMDGILSSAKKDFKGIQMSQSEEFTENGIKGRRQFFTGEVNGVKTVAVVALLNAARPVTIFVQANTEMFGKESLVFFESIRKIENQ